MKRRFCKLARRRFWDRPTQSIMDIIIIIEAQKAADIAYAEGWRHIGTCQVCNDLLFHNIHSDESICSPTQLFGKNTRLCWFNEMLWQFRAAGYLMDLCQPSTPLTPLCLV